MKTLFPLNRDGAVTTYLVTEPRIEDFLAPYTLTDQLEFERQMRGIFYKEPTDTLPDSILGEKSPLGTEWKYYAKNRNPYVDFSTFYFTLKRVDFYARTTLVSSKKKSVRARVWSYAAFDMWLSGVRIATEKVPVYQPIRYTDLTLELAEGENDVFFHIQNFGVRDTRNMLKLQLIDTEGISVTLPVDDAVLSELKAAEEWLLSLRAVGNKLTSDCSAPAGVRVKIGGEIIPFGEGNECEISDEFEINVSFDLHNQGFARRIERPEYRNFPYKKMAHGDPRLDLADTLVNNRKYGKTPAKELYEKELGHSGMNYVLASARLNGGITEYDKQIIECALDYVRERRDCSDFELSEILRLVLTYPIPENLLSKIKEVALGFRYWMDENGADAMCFWSENHALTFFECQMLAGKIWPEERFLRSDRLGKEQYEIGRRRICEWFDVVLAEGFEEFLSGGYMGVTVAALLLIYDFGDKELREKAKTVLDRIATESCIQCFKGTHMAPMGRVYRGVLSPNISSVQGILHLISDDNIDYSCARASNYLHSDYKFPEGLEELMTGEIDTVFNSGRAEVHTRKTKNTMLTSVASPRTTPTVKIEDETTEYFRTKVMNESFHGTTLFIPGGLGYQQHLWYAAISEKFFTFVNLPGSEVDPSGMRPGYWFGNLIFPTVKQNGRELCCHYILPDSIPTRFTHAYYPAALADESREEGNYRFAKVKDSYLALWCSSPLVLHEDVVAGSELRAYGDDVIWYVKVGSKEEDGSFDSFVKEIKSDVSSEYCLDFLS